MSFADVTVLNYHVNVSGVSVWAIWLSLFLSILWVLLLIVASWKIFEKADEAGWKSIIPIYSVFTYLRIAGHNGWGFLLFLIPIVGLVYGILVLLDLARHFGKSVWFAIFGLIIFSAIGHLMLGYGSAEYVGIKHQ